MANKIRRQIIINGEKRWVSGNTEQEYVDNLLKAVANPDGAEEHSDRQAHNFREYAQDWLNVFSKPNVELVTAITYERQLRGHIYPFLAEMAIEDIRPADVQKIFNQMNGARQTKVKVRNVLNMVFEQAIEDELILKNPLKSRSIRITGKSSTPTKPYSVEQMRFLVSRIGELGFATDRAYLALHCLHPLRPEEVLGLKWKDIDFSSCVIHVERCVTHPSRNAPLIKTTKTEASRRTIDFVPQIRQYLNRGAPEQFVIGGDDPLTYTQVRRMCARIQRETGFDEPITPRRFRTTVLTDIYDTTKDIKQAQAAAGHTTASMTLKYYVKGRGEQTNTAIPVATAYGLDN